MSGSFGFSGGQLVIQKDGRTVLSTSGTLVQFLTTERTFSQNCAFPDVPKGEIYFYGYDVNYSALAGGYNYAFTNISTVGARPQEWSNQIVLGAVPAGADIFWGRISLTRTVSPSHAWGNESLTPRVVQGQYMQITGSILLEQVRGLSRVLSVFISGGNLIADLQQSCGPVSGNFGTWGSPLAEGSSARGGENSAPSGAGRLVYAGNPGLTGTGTVENFYSSSPFIPDLVGTAVRFQNGGTNESPYSDPTNYASTYAITVRGRFGRRS